MTQNRSVALIAIFLTGVISAGYVISQDNREEPRDPTKVPLLLRQALVIDANADELIRLRSERRNAALEMLKAHNNLFLGGRGSFDEVVASAERALEAQLDAPGAIKSEVLEEHLEFARAIEKVVIERYRQGVADASTHAMAKYWRLEVEVRLARENEGFKK